MLASDGLNSPAMSSDSM
jgi:hypothetical protein